MGALTWAAGFFGWLPKAGLVKPVLRERRSRAAASLLGHVGYGLLAAAPICAAEMYSRRKAPSWVRRTLARPWLFA
jgi:hypothetical protein